MIAIEPFLADRQIWTTNAAGVPKTKWEPCRVLGVKEKDGEPVYVVEVYGQGESWLDTAELLRRRA